VTECSSLKSLSLKLGFIETVQLWTWESQAIALSHSELGAAYTTIYCKYNNHCGQKLCSRVVNIINNYNKTESHAEAYHKIKYLNADLKLLFLSYLQVNGKTFYQSLLYSRSRAFPW